MLEIIDPLEPDELPWRNLYATPDFISWFDEVLPEMGHNEVYSDLSPYEQTFAVFAEYVAGEYFSDDRRFKKLSCTPDHHVWEFKTEEVRVFGWVPQYDSFICCFGDGKDQIELMQSYGRYIAQTAFVRNNIDLDEPKFLTGRRHSDVISTKD
ncbi:hypothetical protein [uncultured Ruegeria sp.]|uniref:hypothetical protein n=1 Tax=uncultured Ruegeria sp. TaxID=259304 RepID=UPI00262BD5FE|nr:hypothetical protein [uncultured Ruegeria sp.]